MPPAKKKRGCPPCGFIKPDSKPCKNPSLCNENCTRCRIHVENYTKETGCTDGNQDIADNLATVASEKQDLLETQTVLDQVIEALQNEVSDQGRRRDEDWLSLLRNELAERERDLNLVTNALNETNEKLKIWTARARRAVAAQGVSQAQVDGMTENDLLITLTESLPGLHSRAISFIANAARLTTDNFLDESAFLDAAFKRLPIPCGMEFCENEPISGDDWCSIPSERRHGPDSQGRCFDWWELGNMIESGLTYMGEYTIGSEDEPPIMRVFYRKAKLPSDLNNVPFSEAELRYFHKRLSGLNLLPEFPVFDALMKDIRAGTVKVTPEDLDAWGMRTLARPPEPIMVPSQ